MTFAIVYVLCAGGRVPAESDASATARVEAMPLLGSVRSSVLPPPFVQCLTRPVQLRGAVDHPDADVRGALVSVGGGPDAAYVDSHQVRGAPHAVSGVLCCAVPCARAPLVECASCACSFAFLEAECACKRVRRGYWRRRTVSVSCAFRLWHLSPVFMCSLRYNDGMVLRRDSSGASDTDGDGSGSEVSDDSEHDEFLGEAGGGDLGATFQEVSAGGRVMVPPELTHVLVLVAADGDEPRASGHGPRTERW